MVVTKNVIIALTSESVLRWSHENAIDSLRY